MSAPFNNTEEPNLDWQKIYSLAELSKVDGVILSTVKNLPQELRPPDDIMKKWEENTFTSVILQMKRNFIFEQLIQKLDENHINYIIFKGPLLAKLYKDPTCRFTMDVDIFVDDEEKQSTEQIFKDMGYSYVKSVSKEHVSVWTLNRKLNVELHTRLWEDYTDECTEILKQENLTHPNTLIKEPYRNGYIVTMGYTEHLIYQMYHIIKHVTFQGIMLRNFIDTALFVRAYEEEIDFIRFWNCMEKLGYKKFCQQLFCACVQYFNMPLQVLGDETDIPAEQTESFMDAMMRLFVRNDSSALNSASTAVYGAYHDSKSKNSASKIKVEMSLIFPDVSKLSYRYSYAKKYKFLLPVVWVHRALRNLFLGKKQQEKESFFNSVEYSKEKLKVLKELELMH